MGCLASGGAHLGEQLIDTPLIIASERNDLIIGSSSTKSKYFSSVLREE